MTVKKTRVERREEILAAAVSCFSEKGYYETTMDDIVRKSGLSKGALYWHFPNKKELFRSLIEAWHAEFGAMLSDLAAVESARAKLNLLKEALKRSVAIRPELARAQIEFYAMAVREDEYRVWLREMYAEQFAILQGLIEEGMRRGEFRSFDSSRLVRMLGSYIDGLMLQQQIHDHAEEPAAILDECFETYLALIEVPDRA